MNEDVVNPYLVKVSIRNNLIIRAIRAAGYKNVSRFCEQNGMGKTELTELISLRRSPLTAEGVFSNSAKNLMENLCALPTDLWTPEQLTMKLKKNTATTEVDFNAMVAALGMNSEEVFQLIDSSSPDKELEKEEAYTVVNDILDTLTPREAKVLRMRFGIDCAELTLEEIGEKWDLSKERIRQIEAKAMRKMKNPSRIEILKGVIE